METNIIMCCTPNVFFINSIVDKYEVNASLCASVIALLMAMIGISLPLIINSTSKVLSEYQNEYITQMFKEEKDYKYLKDLIPWIIVGCLLVFFLSDFINTINWLAFALSVIIVVLAIISIFKYIRFLKRFTEYAISTDKVVMAFVNGKLKDFITQKNPGNDASEIVDLYAKMLQKKARYNCDGIFYKSFKILTDYIKMLSVIVKEEEKNRIDSDLWIKFSLTVSHYYRSYFDLVRILMKQNVENMEFLHKTFKQALQDLFYCRPLVEAGTPFDNVYRAYAYHVTNADILNDSKGFLQKFAWEWWFDLQRDERMDDINFMPLSLHLFPIMRVLAVRGVSTSIIAFISQCIENIEEFARYKQQHKKDYEIINNQTKTISVDSIATLNELMQCSILADTMKNTQPAMIQAVKKQFLRNQAYVEVIRVGAYCKFKHVDEVTEYIMSFAEILKPVEATRQMVLAVLKERQVYKDNMRELNYIEEEEVIKFLDAMK